VDHAQGRGLSERKECRLVNQLRGTQRYRPTQREDEDAITRAIIGPASQYGRYGYRPGREADSIEPKQTIRRSDHM
jgi:putative transposase